MTTRDRPQRGIGGLSESGSPSPTRPSRRFRPSPTLAAFLSLLVPGMGQLAAGRIIRGVLVALPAVGVVVVSATLFARGRVDAVATLVSPGVLDGILIANVVLAVYHAWAIFDARRVARAPLPPARRPRLTNAIVGVLIAVALVAHGTLEVVGFQARETLVSIFDADTANSLFSIPAPSFEPTATPSPFSSSGAAPTQAPTASPGPAWAADGRLNILLIGGDSGPGRWSLRTDTMEVLSVDLATGHAALFGIPRNLVNVPLAPEDAGAFPAGIYPDLLNSLYVYASGHPNQFPGGDARGFRAVSGAIQELVGVPLDGAVVVNLNGFVRLVNAMGGLWVQVPQEVTDYAYPLEDGSGYVQLDIKAGCHHFSGHLALAYARSRHMDSDYGRMGRQQQVLVDMANQFDPIALLPKIPDLLSIAKDDLWTTFSGADAAPLATALAGVDTGAVKQILFDPPVYPEYVTDVMVKKVRSVVRSVFKAASAPSPGASASPTPKPTATPSCG